MTKLVVDVVRIVLAVVTLFVCVVVVLIGTEVVQPTMEKITLKLRKETI